MPNAIPAGADSSLPPAGRIDPRGMRFGAGISAILLVGAFLADARWIVPLVLLSLGTSAAFGMRFSIYGTAWKRLVPLLKLGKAEPEHEYPPRFAQTLGSIALTLSLLAFIVGWTALGWAFALAVAALQTLLAVTGYCLGCRLYFLRWWLPSLATSFWTRGRRTKADGAFGGSFSAR